MLARATHQQYETANAGTLERGEFVASLRKMGDLFCWSKDRVKRFLSDLEVRTAIETVRETPDGTVYRIVNYDTYAIGSDSERDTMRDSERDRSETEARQEQEQKNRKTDNKPPRRKSQLPDDWAPHDAHKSKAKELGLSVDSEGEGFRLHAKANGRTQLDWDAAFFMWLHNAVKFGRASKAPEQGVDADFVAQELAKREKAMAEIEARRSA